MRVHDIASKPAADKNIQACKAACAAITVKSGASKACAYFNWYQYRLVEQGRCILSSAAGKTNLKKADGWMSHPVDIEKPKMQVGEYKVHSVTESVGGPLVLCVASNKQTNQCEKTTSIFNPSIHFSTPDKEATQIYPKLVGSEVLTALFPRRDSALHPKTDVPDAYIMKSPRKDCQKHLFKAGSSFVGFSTSKTDRTIQFYKHDPRLRLLDNTLDSPADISAARDAGVFGLSTAQAKCPLVIPNFLNEGKCVRHIEGTCSPLEFITDKRVKLDRTSLRLWYTTSHKHVLAVDGIPAESSPCTPLLRSRWRLVSGKCKGGPSLSGDTKATLLRALRKQNSMCDTFPSRLPEDERSYSSVLANHPPGVGYARSRIDSPLGWAAGKNKVGEWLQFDFGAVRSIAGTVVQPRKGNSGQYVKAYTVQHSFDGKNWVDVPGKYVGSKTEAKNSYFPAPVSGRYLRLVVTDWQKHISMRADVLLCRFGDSPNANIRDVVVSDLDDGTCAESKSTIGTKIQVTTDTCWEHVHQDTLNVYDFTGPSVKDCPSKVLDPRRNPFNAAAEGGSHVFQYTDTAANWKTFKSHSRRLGDTHVLTLKYVGRFGDEVAFEDFEPDLQTLPMADALGVKSTKSTVAFDACGSRAEVANEPLLGNMFYFDDERCFDISTFQHRRRLDFQHTLQRGKEMIFTNLVLKAPDQLRQRVAWALSQIFVISQAVGCPRPNLRHGQSNHKFRPHKTSTLLPSI